MVPGERSHQVTTNSFRKSDGSCFRDAIVRQVETSDAREGVEVVRDRNGAFITDHVVTHLFYKLFKLKISFRFGVMLEPKRST